MFASPTHGSPPGGELEKQCVTKLTSASILCHTRHLSLAHSLYTFCKAGKVFVLGKIGNSCLRTVDSHLVRI